MLHLHYSDITSNFLGLHFNFCNLIVRIFLRLKKNTFCVFSGSVAIARLFCVLRTVCKEWYSDNGSYLAAL